MCFNGMPKSVNGDLNWKANQRPGTEMGQLVLKKKERRR